MMPVPYPLWYRLRALTCPNWSCHAPGRSFAWLPWVSNQIFCYLSIALYPRDSSDSLGFSHPSHLDVCVFVHHPVLFLRLQVVLFELTSMGGLWMHTCLWILKSLGCSPSMGFACDILDASHLPWSVFWRIFICPCTTSRAHAHTNLAAYHLQLPILQFGNRRSLFRIAREGLESTGMTNRIVPMQGLWCWK